MPFRGYHRYGHKQSARLFTLRWVAVLQFTVAILLLVCFVVSVVTFAQASRDKELQRLNLRHENVTDVIGNIDAAVHFSIGTIVIATV